MGSYFLRIEAMNLGCFVYDTEDLSTIRGAGLLLLNWPRVFQPSQEDKADGRTEALERERFLEKHANATNHEVVTRGASVAIYWFEAACDEAARRVRADAERFFREHEKYRHATFVVDVVQAEREAFAKARERLVALNRFGQTRQCTTPVPERNTRADEDAGAPFDQKSGNPYCDIDATRPGFEPLHASDPGINTVSRSTSERRAYGRKLKMRLYALYGGEDEPRDQREPDRLAAVYPTWTLDRLTVRGEARVPADRRLLGEPDPLAGLTGKMAVIYADGNSFGKVQSEHCGTIRSQQEWDQYIQRRRGVLKRRLCELIQADPAWQVEPTKEDRRHAKEADLPVPEVVHRIETLLWGGDEMIWVVPAWRGWETLRLFFEETRGWRYPPDDGSGTPLTHAAGLVFANHKAPIRDIVKLAKGLAEHCKEETEREGDSFAYQVMESFDSFAGQDVKEVRDRLTPPDVKPGELVIRGDQPGDMVGKMEAIESLVRRFRDTSEPFPRRQVYRLLAAQKGNDGGMNGKRYEKALKRVTKVDHTLGPLLADAKAVYGPACWYQLAELWDYIPEKRFTAERLAETGQVEEEAA